MSLLARLNEFFLDVLGPEGAAVPDETSLTVAALLVLVARIDGRVLKVEEEGLRALLRSRFGIGREDADRVLAQVDEIGQEVDQASTLAARIGHDIAPEERSRVLAMAYRMAAIDGFVHEFEEDLLWRIGRLLGQSDAEIALARDEALKNLAPERARNG
jgi:uncharacterized tellurite resistance protein B-like protein